MEAPVNKKELEEGNGEFADTISGTAAPSGNRHARMMVPLLLILTIVAAGGIFWWHYASLREETDDAYVNGHITNISSRVSGTVTDVTIEENQRVKPGQLLVALDPRDYEVAAEQIEAALERDRHEANAAKSKIDQSSLSALGRTTEASGDINAVEADIASSRAALLQSRDKVRVAESHVKEQQAQLEFARTDFERYKTVYENRAVTKQQYDKARQTLDVYVAQLQQARDNLEDCRKQELMAASHVDQAIGRLKRSHGSLTTARAIERQSAIDTEQYGGSLAALKKDEAALKQAKLQLSYTKITAPLSGKIGKKSVEIGQRVEPGQALMSLVQDDFWVTANFKETQVGRMRVGQDVEITIDAFGDRKFKAVVESLSPASGAKFSLLPPDNATGNFTKVVQRIPVRLKLDSNGLSAYQDRLAPGMSCVVTVFVGK
jgi:membrane fusion protein, multidrug efflux system